MSTCVKSIFQLLMYLEIFISGYYQKSVILMSKLPLVTFFPQVTSVIARKFFEFGDVSIETAAKDIDSWTLPSPGHSVELPLMGHLFQLTIPSLSTRSGMYLHFRFRKKRSFSVKLHNFFNLSRIFPHFFRHLKCQTSPSSYFHNQGRT